MPSLSDFYERDEELSRTLFTVVPDEATAQCVIEAARHLIGDLDQPDTGLLVVLPVE